MEAAPSVLRPKINTSEQIFSKNSSEDLLVDDEDPLDTQEPVFGFEDLVFESHEAPNLEFREAENYLEGEPLEISDELPRELGSEAMRAAMEAEVDTDFDEVSEGQVEVESPPDNAPEESPVSHEEEEDDSSEQQELASKSRPKPGLDWARVRKRQPVQEAIEPLFVESLELPEIKPKALTRPKQPKESKAKTTARAKSAINDFFAEVFTAAIEQPKKSRLKRATAKAASQSETKPKKVRLSPLKKSIKKTMPSLNKDVARYISYIPKPEVKRPSIFSVRLGERQRILRVNEKVEQRSSAAEKQPATKNNKANKSNNVSLRPTANVLVRKVERTEEVVKYVERRVEQTTYDKVSKRVIKDQLKSPSPKTTAGYSRTTPAEVKTTVVYRSVPAASGNSAPVSPNIRLPEVSESLAEIDTVEELVDELLQKLDKSSISDPDAYHTLRHLRRRIAALQNLAETIKQQLGRQAIRAIGTRQRSLAYR